MTEKGAESGVFIKSVRKKTARAKEQLLVRLGKADKTTDEVFETHVADFNQQQQNAERLQKDMKHYVACIDALTKATRSLNDSIRVCYEEEWPNHPDIKAITQSIELTEEQFCDRLNSETVTPLNSYCSHFPDIKAKIAKRGRKLTDYDSARHHLSTLTGKPNSDLKTQKAKEQLDEAQRYYEEINKELLDVLPKLYENRIPFTVENLKSFFASAQSYHADNSRYCQDVEEQLLKFENESGSFKDSSFMKEIRENRPVNNVSVTQSSPKAVPVKPPVSKTVSSKCESSEQVKIDETRDRATTEPDPFAAAAAKEDGSKIPVVENNVDTTATKKDDVKSVNSEHGSEKLYPTEALKLAAEPGSGDGEVKKTFDLAKHTVLYKVRAAHPYKAEDEDELSFDSEDLIHVVEYDGEEEQDEGWLMGILDSHKTKGVFPGNFTKRVEE